MQVIIGSDQLGKSLKNNLIDVLKEAGFNILDVTKEEELDFVSSTLRITEKLLKDKDSLGIAIDGYGAGSFMTATKIKGMVAAEVSDERSAYMTREHNDSRLITMGSEIVGEKLAENICLAFLNASYDGGRHQIRVDMLNKMG